MKRPSWLNLSTIIAALALILSYKSYQSNQETIIKSGALDKPNLLLSINDYPLTQKPDTDTVTLIYGAYLKKDSCINVTRIPIELNNFSKKNAEDVKIIFKFPKTARLSITDTVLLTKPSFNITNVNRSISSNKKDDLITYRMDEINSGLSISIEEPVFLNHTIVKGHIDTFNFEYLVSFAYLFTTTVIGKNIQPQKTYFQFSCYNYTSYDELINTYVKNKNRVKNKKEKLFLITPKIRESQNIKGYALNEYDICDTCLTVAYIDDKYLEESLIVAIYKNNRLIKTKVYNKENIFIKDIFF